MKKAAANWLATAAYDLDTAEAMHFETRSRMPPRTHDLLYLVRELALTPPRAHLDFIGIVNNASVPTRYPEDLSRLVSQYPRRTAISYLARTKRVLKWLRRHPSLAGT